MKCIKKIPSALFIIIPIILVLVLVYFLFGSSLNEYLRGSKVRPIEELFAMDFSDLEEPQIEDLSKCDSTRILNEREEKISEGKIEGAGELTIEDNCWRTYENDFVKFSFRDFNDTVRIRDDSKDDVGISFRYEKNDILEVGRFDISIYSKNNTGIATDFCKKDYFSPATEDNIRELENKIDIDDVTVNGRWNYYDIIKNADNCNKKFVYLDTFVNKKGTKIDRAYYDFYGSEQFTNKSYYINAPGEDYYFIFLGKGYQVIDILSTIEIK
jgi:hypothetical protein